MKKDIERLFEEKRMCEYMIRNCKKDLEHETMNYESYCGCMLTLQENEKKLEDINNCLETLRRYVLI